MATSDQEYNDRIIRRSIGLSHPAAVRAVDRLVEQGLVRRRRVGRGAAAALTATAAGRREREGSSTSGGGCSPTRSPSSRSRRDPPSPG